MQSGQLNKRIEQQLRHIEDMINEQNRMVLAEVEPTDSEREDMLILLSEIKGNAEKSPKSFITSLSPRYDGILNDLSSLGYNISSYGLVFPRETKPTRDASGENGQQARPRKQVHFDDNSNEARSADTSYALSIDDETPREGSTPNGFDNSSYSASQIYEQNEFLMEDHDRRLLEIGNSVGRQRAMGESINSELGVHNNLLEDLESQVDYSHSRLDRLTNGVKTFNRKSRECGTCSIILVLVLILFIVLII